MYLTGLICDLSGRFFGSGCGLEQASHTASAPAYVGREVCAGCHAEAALAWEGSDHDRAMEEALPETVLGDFDDAVFRHCGIETRFFREDDGFFIRTQGADGTMQSYPVAYTFGYEPLQQYLIPLENGRLQAFTVAWDTQGERWFSLAEDECIDPPDWLHWTARRHELELHVRGLPLHQPATQFQSGCRRLRDLLFGNRRELRDMPRARGSPCGKRAIRNVRPCLGPASQRPFSAPHQQVETCAPCHSRRRIIYPNHIAGNAVSGPLRTRTARRGTVLCRRTDTRRGVRVYGSFLQSRMYAEGVMCADCHDPHTTRLKFEGNALCGQCHEAAVYDTFEHLRHPQESAGGQCVDCHMPERTYMVVDPRRDHSFKIPRPRSLRPDRRPQCVPGVPCGPFRGMGCRTNRGLAWTGAPVLFRRGPCRRTGRGSRGRAGTDPSDGGPWRPGYRARHGADAAGSLSHRPRFGDRHRSARRRGTARASRRRAPPRSTKTAPKPIARRSRNWSPC